MNDSAVQQHEKEKSRWITTIKLACTATTATFFGLGIRAAWKQARPVEPTDLTKFKIMSGVGFASRALGIATLLTLSGYGLFVMGIVTLMDVHTPSQFGAKMKDVFGDRLRISKGTGNQSYESLSELFEAVAKKENDNKDGVKSSKIA